MVGILVVGASVVEYIVKVDHDTGANQREKGLIHNPYKCARCVREGERHDEPFKDDVPGIECFLPFFPWANPNLVVPTLKVQFGEDDRATLFYPRDRPRGEWGSGKG